ncbi:MAG: DUF3572 family protein [Sphingomicrobium sp.]
MHKETPTDPFALALSALAATLDEPRRAQRFLDLTGIGTEELRQRAGEPRLLASLIAFLEAHEPDLLAVSAAIGLRADELVAARHALEDAGGL